jgi:hypothetical protein
MYKGVLELRSGSKIKTGLGPSAEQEGEITVFLLDHALLMVKREIDGDRVFAKVSYCSFFTSYFFLDVALMSFHSPFHSNFCK